MTRDLDQNKRHFWDRFKDAFSGIGQAFIKERNLQFHFVAAIGVFSLGLYFRISRPDWIALCLVIGGVISLELVNTAIERVVDLVTLEKHPLAKAAKDIAAGAVLFFSIVALVIGCLIFIHYIR